MVNFDIIATVDDADAAYMAAGTMWRSGVPISFSLGGVTVQATPNQVNTRNLL